MIQAPEGRSNVAQRFSVCVRTDVLAIRWNEELENAAPEGRTNVAQRFSVCVRTDVLAIRWNEELKNAAPEGRTNVAQRFSVCVRTDVLGIRCKEEFENAAPEGRTNLAQRFSAGKSGKNDLSPGGTTQFSRTHFSPRGPGSRLGKPLMRPVLTGIDKRWTQLMNLWRALRIAN